jgi:L-arabinose isomerase
MTPKAYAFWLLPGSQEMYGQAILQAVTEDAQAVAREWNEAGGLPYPVVARPVVASPQAIAATLEEAARDPLCAGVVLWMHTFSPARMWIGPLLRFPKPILHLHTQFYRDIPWDNLDMVYMNLHQSAHADRELGHLLVRLGIRRTLVVGHWRDEGVRRAVASWMRACVGRATSWSLRIARFGDNMRDVADTESDKTLAQSRLGWQVNGYGAGTLAERLPEVEGHAVEQVVAAYREAYELPREVEEAHGEVLRQQARLELALRSFLQEGGFEAFTTNFQEIHGLPQLPGLAVQRLMAEGYGFGAEGDWQTAGLVRVAKAMDVEDKGTSFMEDYTYHLEPGREMVLGAHMLEICPTVAAVRPRVVVHPLFATQDRPTARLVFHGKPGEATVASLVTVGTGLRLVVGRVEAVAPPHALPRLPVAHVLWRPLPSFHEGVAAWLEAGGGHHTAFSYGVGAQEWHRWAEVMGLDHVGIGDPA